MASVLKIEEAMIGVLPYFAAKPVDELRVIKCHQAHKVEKFPRLVSLTRIEDVLEMNLFLEHRYRGIFMPPNRGGHSNSLGY